MAEELRYLEIFENILKAMQETDDQKIHMICTKEIERIKKEIKDFEEYYKANEVVIDGIKKVNK